MEQATEQSRASEYEKLRERLSPIVSSIRQLESKRAVINPRIIVHGSSVSGTKTPSDTDVLIIFDKLDACPPDASDDERKMYEAMKTKKVEGGKILELNGIDAYPEDTDEFMAAIRKTKEAQIADLLANFGAIAVKIYREVPGEEMLEIVKYLPCLILAAEPRSQKPFYEQITGKPFNRGQPANFISVGIISIKRVLLLKQEEAGTGLFDEMYRKIDNQFSNKGDCKNPIQAKTTITQLVNFVGNQIELTYASLGYSEVGIKRAAQLRGFYQMYSLGLNFLQACVVNGGVIIYGPNIETDPETQRLLGLKGKYLFKEDRGLIKIKDSTPSPA